MTALCVPCLSRGNQCCHVDGTENHDTILTCSDPLSLTIEGPSEI